MTAPWWTVAIAVAASACGGGSETAAPGSGSGSGSGSSAVAAALPPLSPKIHAARCDEPCLFLVDTPLSQLDAAFAAACPGKTSPNLGFEDCSGLDYVRNCIYAAHGLVYTKKKWKGVFANKAWYAPDSAVAAKTVLGDVERANVHELNERGKACKKGFQISGADYDRVKAWFGAWPKRPPLPPVVFADGAATDAAGFETKVQAALGTGKVWLSGKVTGIYLGDDLHATGADYPSDDMPAAMVTAIHAADDKELRGIRVRFPDPQQPGGDFTGTDVFVVYDRHDKLRGVEIRPFAYEACVGDGDCD